MAMLSFTIKGGFRHAEKSRKELMMMMKLPNWGGQGRSRTGVEPSRVKQSRAERGQELGRIWGGARNVPDRSLKEAGQEYGKGWVEFGEE